MSTQKSLHRRASLSATLILALLANMLLNQTLQAETYYKWLDNAGVWHYGAIPPHGVEAIPVETTGAGKARSSSTPNDTASNGAENGSGTGTESSEFYAEQPIPVPKKERNRLCQAARANLETLNSKAVIRKRDADGNVTVISDKERQNEIETAEQAIKDFC